MPTLPTKLSTSVLLTGLALSGSVSANLEISINYLQQEVDSGPVLSNILPEPEDSGLRGAELGIKDSNTTGRFLKQKYLLNSISSDQADELVKQATELYQSGQRFFVINSRADTLQKITAALGPEALIFNAGSADDRLRKESCDSRVLHTLPSRAMLNDALAQWLKAKRLSKVLIITGPTDEDKAYSAAFKRAAKRFGIKTVAEKEWSFDTDLRRTAQKELPCSLRAKNTMLSLWLMNAVTSVNMCSTTPGSRARLWVLRASPRLPGTGLLSSGARHNCKAVSTS